MDAIDLETERHIYTVSEATRIVKELIEDNLFDLWVIGEVSNYRRASSGHIYFTLKDEKAVLKAVLFKGSQGKIPFEIEDGLKVIVHGSMNVFEKRGEYQILVDFIEPEGLGALQLAFEQLKRKLEADGLFDPSHKKKIPAFPDVIGVVTSETGAAIRDILKVISRRHSGVHIIIYPTIVQGDGAAESISDAIRKANERNEVDVLIVGRGGGSIEDLWPFNEEIVARALYESRIPVISAVGHEIDFTISDFVADLRAPTPSAAAELVVKNKEELIRWFRDMYLRLNGSIDRILRSKAEALARYEPDFLYQRMSTILHEKQLILDDLTRSLTILMDGILSRVRGRFENAVGQLNVLSPLSTLSRGYSFITKLPENTPVFSVEEVEPGNEIRSRLKDGFIFSRVKEIEKMGG
ncbi:MAG: exodeoxyribonuclease VII large subunit [Spirochaetota bacterium]